MTRKELIFRKRFFYEKWKRNTITNYREINFFFKEKWQKLVNWKSHNNLAHKFKPKKRKLISTYNKKNLIFKLNSDKRKQPFLNDSQEKYKAFLKHKNINIISKFSNYRSQKKFFVINRKLRKNVLNNQIKFRINKGKLAFNYIAKPNIKNYNKFNPNYRNNVNVSNFSENVNHNLPYKNTIEKSYLYIDRLNFKFDENKNILRCKYKKKY
jgi:hypothetical protein